MNATQTKSRVKKLDFEIADFMQFKAKDEELLRQRKQYTELIEQANKKDKASTILLGMSILLLIFLIICSFILVTVWRITI